MASRQPRRHSLWRGLWRHIVKLCKQTPAESGITCLSHRCVVSYNALVKIIWQIFKSEHYLLISKQWAPSNDDALVSAAGLIRVMYQNVVFIQGNGTECSRQQKRGKRWRANEGGGSKREQQVCEVWAVNSPCPQCTLADLPVLNRQNQTRCNHFLQPSSCLSVLEWRRRENMWGRWGGPVKWPPADPACVSLEPMDDKPDVLSVWFPFSCSFPLFSPHSFCENCQCWKRVVC